MTVGVVIVTYNRIKLLKECLERVLNQTQPVTSVIVVDNNSDDGTKEYLDSIDDDRVLVSHERTNLGGAGGFHKALSIASTKNFDYVLIIDDDAMIEKNYIKKIIDFADNNPEYEAFAGAVYTEGEIDPYHRRRLGSRLIFWEKMIPRGMYDRPRRLDFATFCGLVIRGSELKRIGLPIKEYFLWYDDSEFCLRIDGGIALVPKAKLNHKTVLNYITGNILSRITWKHYYGYRNRYDCAKRHLGPLTCIMILGEYSVFYAGSLLMYLNPDKRIQASYNLKMLRRVMMDCITGRLGKNPDYLP